MFNLFSASKNYKSISPQDAKKRIDLMYQAEKMLIDQMVIAPEYFRIAHWTFKKYLTGVVSRGVGANTDFYYADIDMGAKMGQSK